MRVFYRNEQSAVGTEYFSPSPKKPALVVASWKEKFEGQFTVETFNPVTRKDLYQVHDPAYVDGVLDGRIANGFGDRDPRIIEVLPYVAGSMVAAAQYAYKTGEWAFSPTSGAHHACYSHGGGFCTFNFLALAAVEAHESGAKRVGIFDCDQHYGNGTADIIRTLGLDYIRHYSFSGGHGMTAEAWLAQLPLHAEKFMEGLDVLIYNAGADAHINDPLGGLLTTNQLFQRDAIVLQAAFDAGVPVAASLAGGYQDPIAPVLEVHDNTFEIMAKFDQVR